MRTYGPDLSTFESSCAIGPAHPAQAVTELPPPSFTAHPLAIASSPNSAPCVLEGLAKVCSQRVLEHIATNPSTPDSILSKLAEHHSSDVRVAVAENHSTPAESIWKLAKDEDPDVRYQLAENHHLPIQVLRFLSEDDNPYVACRAQRTITRVESAIGMDPEDLRAHRRAELKRRISEVRSLDDGTPMHVLNKLFNSLTRYARAI